MYMYMYIHMYLSLYIYIYICIYIYIHIYTHRSSNATCLTPAFFKSDESCSKFNQLAVLDK